MALSHDGGAQGGPNRTVRSSGVLAVCMLVVGSFGLSAPAYADTTCNFDVTTATLTLDRDAAVSIGHAGDDFVFGGVDQLGNCGPRT